MKLNEVVDTRTKVYQWLVKYDNSHHKPSKEDLKIESWILSTNELWLRPVKNSIDKRFYAPPDVLFDVNQIHIVGFDVSTIKLNWILHTRSLILAGVGDWTKSMPGIIESVGGSGNKILQIQTSTDSKMNLLDLFNINPTAYASVSFYHNGYGQVGSKLAFYVNSNKHGGFVVTFMDDNQDGFDEEVNDQFELQDVLIQNGYERFT
ncbi:hypothetical protein RsoM2USA_314 [Ralstonia phage RsoM2USA]|nr:hypothetical protein RsoM2USA_314 [Ralstonia phage RsoM2USA]